MKVTCQDIYRQYVLNDGRRLWVEIVVTKTACEPGRVRLRTRRRSCVPGAELACLTKRRFGPTLSSQNMKISGRFRASLFKSKENRQRRKRRIISLIREILINEISCLQGKRYFIAKEMISCWRRSPFRADSLWAI